MRSLTFKLTLAFLIVSLTGIALVAVLVWGITASEFNRFLTDRGLNEYTSVVTRYYRIHGSWDGIEETLRDEGLLNSPGQQGTGKNQLPAFLLVDQIGQVIIPVGPLHQGERLPIDRNERTVPVTVNNQVVGYILTTGRPPRANQFEERFLFRTNMALILAAMGAVITAVLLGLFLARTITRPVRDLIVATSAMAKGQLNQQVPVRSNDELGELTQTFNQMSADLERGNRLRQQMTADIAHDLRTPLSVITGYLEGLKDGVVKPSPQRFEAMYAEAIYLQRLVEDLRLLSLADAGELSMNCQTVQPGEQIERLTAHFQHQADLENIRLTAAVEPNLPGISVDPERLYQALSNLVSNALRYTPAGGEITLAARRQDGEVWIEVKDTGAGITPDALPHIFERFYRGDDSRQEGGSGLGLAIAKSLVELQGGKISAESAGPGTGSLFRIRFPARG